MWSLNDGLDREALAGVDWERVTGITFHRLIDNEEIYLSGEQLWVHLNYHLIHHLGPNPTDHNLNPLL